MQLNQAGKYDASIAAARAAVVLRPGFAEAWNNIAAGYEAEQKWDQAIDAARRAVALKPDFQLAKNNLAWSLSQKEKAKH
jgi:tetratricopeptide (TPR) repeat protein